MLVGIQRLFFGPTFSRDSYEPRKHSICIFHAFYGLEKDIRMPLSRLIALFLDVAVGRKNGHVAYTIGKQYLWHDAKAIRDFSVARFRLHSTITMHLCSIEPFNQLSFSTRIGRSEKPLFQVFETQFYAWTVLEFSYEVARAYHLFEYLYSDL